MLALLCHTPLTTLATVPSPPAAIKIGSARTGRPHDGGDVLIARHFMELIRPAVFVQPIHQQLAQLINISAA